MPISYLEHKPPPKTAGNSRRLLSRLASAKIPMASAEESMIAELRETIRALTGQLGKVIVGQENVIEQLQIGLCNRGLAEVARPSVSGVW